MKPLIDSGSLQVTSRLRLSQSRRVSYRRVRHPRLDAHLPRGTPPHTKVDPMTLRPRSIELRVARLIHRDFQRGPARAIGIFAGPAEMPKCLGSGLWSLTLTCTYLVGGKSTCGHALQMVVNKPRVVGGREREDEVVEVACEVVRA